jgi:hypothetical protein
MAEFGLDVIALIGTLRYTHHHSVPEIHAVLRHRGVAIAERTVTHLLQRTKNWSACGWTITPDYSTS